MKRRPLTAIVAVAIALGAFAGPVAAAPFPTRDEPCLQAGCRRASRRARARRSTSARLQVARCGPGIPDGVGDCSFPPWGGAAVGLKYEAEANRLWVAGGPTATVRVYDASSGELLRHYSFPTATPSFIDDLVVTDTAVYATDSLHAWLNVIPLGTDGALPDRDRRRRCR